MTFSHGKLELPNYIVAANYFKTFLHVFLHCERTEQYTQCKVYVYSIILFYLIINSLEKINSIWKDIILFFG